MSDLHQPPVDLAAAFAELADLSVSPQPLSDILDRTVRLAREVLTVPSEVSITVIAGDQAKTSAWTAEVALALDEAQYRAGYGPCLVAAQAGEPILIDDVAADARWPQYTESALEAGIGSSLSVPLPVQRQVIGALNIYSTRQRSFDDDRRELARQFASYAAVAIGNTTLYMSSAQLAAQMQEALRSRAVIEQAKGVLMAVHGVGPDRAFDLLVEASQRGHRKLRDVAADLVEHTVREPPQRPSR